MTEANEFVFQVSGRRVSVIGFVARYTDLLIVFAFPFFLGWGIGRHEQVSWWAWPLVFGLSATSLARFMDDFCRRAAQPATLILRDGCFRIEPRGAKWSHWHMPDRTLIPLDAAAFTMGYGRLMLSDLKARSASIVLAEGPEVAKTVEQLEAAGFMVQKDVDRT